MGAKLESNGFTGARARPLAAGANNNSALTSLTTAAVQQSGRVKVLFNLIFGINKEDLL